MQNEQRTSQDEQILSDDYRYIFIREYMVCALWSSTGDDGEPLDANYSIDDMAADTRDAMTADCHDFLDSNTQLLAGILMREPPGQAGHDFWLTRNGHGAGFWDRGLGEVGRKLTEAAKVYGSQDLYIGDDGKIYAA